MKSLRWVALLILVTVLSYFYRSRPQPLPATPQTSAPVPVVSSPYVVETKPETARMEPTKAFAPPKVLTKRRRARKGNQYAEKPKDMYVEFEIIDGLAVAYGDTVLGKTTPDFTAARGMTEAAYPKYWADGVIPYFIQKDVKNPERVMKAIEYYNQHTSVRFVPFEDQADALVFVPSEKNCASYLGRMGGIQPVFLSDKCGTTEIAHELMHALGFVHEQSRTDRDQFVQIIWDHIDEKFQSQFAMIPDPLMEPYFDSGFDPTSIMMYDPRIFTAGPGLETMKLKNGAQFADPKRMLSTTDVERLRRLYPPH